MKLVLTAVLCATSLQAAHLNQIGYYQNAKKIAVTDTGSRSFSIQNAEGEIVIQRDLSSKGVYTASNDYVSIADFADITTPGSYKFILNNSAVDSFTVSDTCYASALKSVAKSYYYLRCGVDLPSDYAGKWFRSAGHKADSSLATHNLPNVGTYDVRGGWYDAGDFGKYTVNAGITCGTLMGLHELFPDLLDDGTLNIPESGNGKNDLLDEVKYELDWLIRMQDSDGGVFFKVGPLVWYDMVMPSKDRTTRYIIGKSTTSTLDFAAVMAMAGRIYKDYDSQFAQNCLDRAEQAWQWALANPKTEYPIREDGTGPYEDGNDLTYADEFFWALTELAISTEKAVYVDSLKKIITDKNISGPAWWQDVNSLSFFSLAVNGSIPGQDSMHVRNEIISKADEIASTTLQSPFMIPMTTAHYTWGSAANCGNLGVILAYAHFITGDQKYLDALVLSADFLFGRNPLGRSFVTGLGTMSPFYPHHRQSADDGVKEPVPGLVVGGPNQFTDGADEDLIFKIESGAPPAKCYVDVENSWASNENAINQNAPWVFVLGYLEKTANTGHSSAVSMQKINSPGFKMSTSVSKAGIKIHLENFAEAVSMSIYNLQGKCIAKNKFNGSKREYFLNTQKLSSGTYLLKLQHSSGSYVSNINLVK